VENARLISWVNENENRLRPDKKSVPEKPTLASRRKSGGLTDHPQAPQPIFIFLDSNLSNDLKN